MTHSGHIASRSRPTELIITVSKKSIVDVSISIILNDPDSNQMIVLENDRHSVTPLKKHSPTLYTLNLVIEAEISKFSIFFKKKCVIKSSVFVVKYI